MSEYIPDKWVIVKIDGNNYPTIYKVFACWYGGYAGSDSWKLNSGITRVSREGYVYSFEGSSGSVYECHEDCYGTNFYGLGVLQNMIDTAGKNGITIEILPEDTDWEQINVTNN
jgi:hypothetical protein